MWMIGMSSPAAIQAPGKPKSDLSGRYEPTEYGSLVSRLYVDPVTAELIAHALLEADAFTDIGMLRSSARRRTCPRSS
jgi:replicative superfamily II helicase